MTLTRQQAEQMIVDFLYRELDQTQEAQFRAYLETDAVLAAQVNTLRQVQQLAAESATEEPSAAVSERLIQAARNAQASADRIRPSLIDRLVHFLRPVLYRPAIGLAATAFVVIGVSIVAYQIGYDSRRYESEFPSVQTEKYAALKAEQKELETLSSGEGMSTDQLAKSRSLAKRDAFADSDPLAGLMDAKPRRKAKRLTRPSPAGVDHGTVSERTLARAYPKEKKSARRVSKGAYSAPSKSDRTAGEGAYPAPSASARGAAARPARRAAVAVREEMAQDKAIDRAAAALEQETADDREVQRPAKAWFDAGIVAAKRQQCDTAMRYFDRAVRLDHAFAAEILKRLGGCKAGLAQHARPYPALVKQLRAAGWDPPSSDTSGE